MANISTDDIIKQYGVDTITAQNIAAQINDYHLSKDKKLKQERIQWLDDLTSSLLTGIITYYPQIFRIPGFPSIDDVWDLVKDKEIMTEIAEAIDSAIINTAGDMTTPTQEKPMLDDFDKAISNFLSSIGV